MKENRYLIRLRDGEALAFPDQIRLIIQLSIPAIMAQLSSVMMQYIDASMVGTLGKNAAAAVGLMASSTWFVNGLCLAAACGFYVQVAQAVGAGKNADARRITYQGLVVTLVFGTLLALIGGLLSAHLPRWYGAESAIRSDASGYFLIFSLAIPLLEMNLLAGGALQGSGNMALPSLLQILMCVLDVIFNYLLIFPSREVVLAGSVIRMPGAGMGVRGAALGTALSIAVCSLIMLYVLLVRSEQLRLQRGEKLRFVKADLVKAFRIGWPVALERGVINGAQIAGTRIIAPLGAVSIAAHSFATTAESICYLPGYGVAQAAITIIGQSVGARRRDLQKRLSWLLTGFGMAVMAVGAVLVYVCAPLMIGLLTKDPEVSVLAVRIVRIAVFIEPMFGASIVISGIFRGEGETLASSLINLGCMWLVRIPLMLLLTGRFGLVGAWYAMCIELFVRGALFLIWLYRKGRRK